MQNNVIKNKNIQLYGQKTLNILFKNPGIELTTVLLALTDEKLTSNLEKAGEKIKREHKN